MHLKYIKYCKVSKDLMGHLELCQPDQRKCIQCIDSYINLTNWVIIGPGNGLSPVPRQDITWTNAGLLSTRLLGTYSLKFESKFYHFHSRKCNWMCRLPKWQPFCPGGDELVKTRASIEEATYTQGLVALNCFESTSLDMERIAYL